MESSPGSEFLSVEDLADRYMVPVPTIYAWLHKGTAPPSIKLGKYRRFRRSDVLAWEQSRADAEDSRATA